MTVAGRQKKDIKVFEYQKVAKSHIIIQQNVELTLIIFICDNMKFLSLIDTKKLKHF